MTFDDRGSIESWGEARAFLNENGIRATFFVDRPYAFSERHLEILKQLAKDGHEIGSHGWQHRKVTVFKKDGQLDAERYLAEEVLPSIRELARMGFSIRSFAYPSGESDPKVDALLLEHLDVLRTVDDRKARYVGPRQGGLVGAMTLDRRWRQGEIEELLDELAPVGGVLVLSGHKIGESRGYCWSAKMDIETIVHAVKARKLSFYTLGELAADRQ